MPPGSCYTTCSDFTQAIGLARWKAAGVCAEVVLGPAFQEKHVVVADVVGGEVDAVGVEVVIEIAPKRAVVPE